MHGSMAKLIQTRTGNEFKRNALFFCRMQDGCEGGSLTLPLSQEEPFDVSL
jgi:hypothetical protein